MEYVFIPDYDALDVEQKILEEYNALDTSVLERTSSTFVPTIVSSPPLIIEEEDVQVTYIEPAIRELEDVQVTYMESKAQVPLSATNVEPRIQQVLSGTKFKIPKTILQITREKNTLIEALSNSVKEYMPDWDYVLMTEIDADKFVQQTYPDYWITYSNYKYWEQKRNSIIFLWLYKNGGLYIDINYRMMSSLEPKLSLDAELYLMQSPDVETYYTISLLGGVSQHSLWKACIEEMRTLAKYPPKWSISKELYISATTGTIMFSSIVSKINTPYYVLPVSSVAPRNVCGNKSSRETGVLYQTYSCDNSQGMEQWVYSMYVCNPVWFYIIIIIVILLLIWLLVKSISYFYKSRG